MLEYTVSELAKLSGVTVRTLHHYDALGLLKPKATGQNGYRYYGGTELRLLQQILFHRKLGIALRDIGVLLELPDTDRSQLLREHRKAISTQATQTAALIVTLDRRIAELEGMETMQDTDLYQGISPDKQAEYDAWLLENLGPEVAADIARSNQAFAQLDEHGQAAALQELADVENALAHAQASGVPHGSSALDVPLNRHRAWVVYMWAKPCSLDAYAGLAEMYLAHPDFEKRYEAISIGFTKYLTDAMKAYATRLG